MWKTVFILLTRRKIVMDKYVENKYQLSTRLTFNSE